MRKLRWIVAAASAALILTACGTSGTSTPPPSGPDGDTVDETVTATTRSGTTANLSEQPSVDTQTLPPGGDRLYRLRLPSSDEPALYVYLDDALDLYLYHGTGSAYATSSSSAFFAAGLNGLALQDDTPTLDPQAVAAVQTCPGSCIISENPGSGSVYVRVHNPTGQTQTVTLWALLTDFADQNEAAASPGDPLPFDTDESGAIETLGDEDYFLPTSSGTLFFQAAEGTPLSLVAEVRDPFGDNPTRTVYPDGSVTVNAYEEIVVYAEDAPPRAAASASSRYFLFFD